MPLEAGRPTCLIARTSKGRGVSFMEDRVEWHHRVPTDDELARALDELEEASDDDRPLHDCRNAFAETLIALAEVDPRIVAVVNDSVGSSNLKDFEHAFPTGWSMSGSPSRTSWG